MLENKVYILDNLIPKNYQDFLENIINTQVPFWLKTSNSSGVPTSDYIKFYNIQDKLYDGPQMIHYLINKIEDETLLPSVYYELISPIFHYVQSAANYIKSEEYEPEFYRQWVEERYSLKNFSKIHKVIHEVCNE